MRAWMLIILSAILCCACAAPQSAAPVSPIEALAPLVAPENPDSRYFLESTSMADTMINGRILSCLGVSAWDAVGKIGPFAETDTLMLPLARHGRCKLLFFYSGLNEGEISDISQITRIWCRAKDIFITDIDYDEALRGLTPEYYSNASGDQLGLAPAEGYRYTFRDYGCMFTVYAMPGTKSVQEKSYVEIYWG